MKNLIRSMILLFFGVVLAGSMISTAHAGDANFKHANPQYTSNGTWIAMCKDWVNSPGDGRNEPGTCKPGGTQRALKPWMCTDSSSFAYCNVGFGWTDTDGFFVRSGYDVAIKPDNIWIRYRSYGWRKVIGCGDCRIPIKQYAE